MTGQWTSRWTRLLVGMALSLSLVWASPTSAQPDVQQPSEEEAAAQAAFDEGMRLMDAGHYEQACERIAKSLELDPGMAAQFRLAECYERLGRTASAWKNYNDVAHAAGAAGMQERERVAQQRAQRLQTKLATVVITVSETVASVPGLQVKRDGVNVPPKLWDAPIPVDPGAVQVVATAPGHEPWSTEVVIAGDGDVQRIEIPPFPDAGGSAGATAGDEGMSGQTIAGITLAAIGTAAMGAGVIIGVAAKPRYDESDDHCQDDLCDQEGLDIRDSVRTQGNIATAVFVIGAAALVGGAVLWITAPSGGGEDGGADVASAELRRRDAAQRYLQVGVSPGGLLLRGAF